MNILPFPCGTSATLRRAQRKVLLSALRVSGSPVILDLSGCPTLNHEGIELVLECMAQVAGRDTQLLFVAGSRANQALLEVTRIPSLVPVFNSVEEALGYPESAPGNGTNGTQDQRANPSQKLWSA
ncbi:MAG: STAS domain-containing protein [Candidatus Sulfotelmatobacter sp.]